MAETTTRDVCIVGGGPADLTAGLFTERAGLDTVVLSSGEPILCRNAHLENVPGFPAGVNSRLFLEMLEDQADRNDCARRERKVTDLSVLDTLFEVETESETIRSRFVICTSWADTDYLGGIDGVGLTKRGSKIYVDVDSHGATGVDGLYAAGRIAEKHHQTVVVAGDGASVALEVIDESDVPFYHDWVAPDGYFTGRDREIPPGCEEITEAERKEREQESMAVMKEYFSEPTPDGPTQHPSVRED